VIIPDVNLLLYAIDGSSPQHGRARQWLQDQLSGVETVAFSWTVLLGFLRLATNPRVFVQPLDVSGAVQVVSGWLDQPNVTITNPTDRHLSIFRDLLDEIGTAGNLTMDAHLAALAIEHGADIHSADSDFARFAAVTWVNPLANGGET